MVEPAPAEGWAAALLAALRAGLPADCPVALPADAEGNPMPEADPAADQASAVPVAPVAPVARREEQNGAAPDPIEAAEREAIMSERALPPIGTEARRRHDAAHRRMVEGLLGASRIPPGLGPSNPEIRRAEARPVGSLGVAEGCNGDNATRATGPSGNRAIGQSAVGALGPPWPSADAVSKGAAC